MCIETQRTVPSTMIKPHEFIVADYRGTKKKPLTKIMKKRRRFRDAWFDLDTRRLYVMTARLGRGNNNNNNNNDNNNVSLISILSEKRLETII